MTHSDMLYQQDVSTFYLYEPLLFQIFVPWKKNLDHPLSTISFTVNSQADNLFYKYFYLFQVLYTVEISFLIKIQLKIFYIEP